MERKDFAEILKRCSFYVEFEENVINCEWVDLDDLLTNDDEFSVKEWIDDAFHWASTNQGQDYWKRINDIWQKFVKTEDESVLGEYLPKTKTKSKGKSKKAKPEDGIDKKFRISVRGKKTHSLSFVV